MIDTFYSLDIEHGYPLGKFCHIPPENLEPENHRLKSTPSERYVSSQDGFTEKLYKSFNKNTSGGQKNTPSLNSWSFLKNKFEIISHQLSDHIINRLHPGRSTCARKRDHFKRESNRPTIISSGGYVSFQEFGVVKFVFRGLKKSRSMMMRFTKKTIHCITSPTTLKP